MSVTREKMHAYIAVAMGKNSRIEIIFGHDKVTSGASSDIEPGYKNGKKYGNKIWYEHRIRYFCIRRK